MHQCAPYWQTAHAAQMHSSPLAVCAICMQRSVLCTGGAGQAPALVSAMSVVTACSVHVHQHTLLHTHKLQLMWRDERIWCCCCDYALPYIGPANVRTLMLPCRLPRQAGVPQGDGPHQYCAVGNRHHQVQCCCCCQLCCPVVSLRAVVFSTPSSCSFSSLCCCACAE
jgi:hypothetical protein